MRVGFIVGRPVGNAVTRNRVKRRLRHLAARRLPSTPPDVDLVIRALPKAGVADDLVTDLDKAWLRATDRVTSQSAVAR